MDNKIKEYLESGIVEDYCLGLLDDANSQQLMTFCESHLEVQTCLKVTQKSMESFIGSFKRKAPKSAKRIIKNNILDKLKLEKAKLIGKDQMLEEFIGISRHSNVNKWEHLIKDIKPPVGFDDIYAKPLFLSENRELLLIWARELVPEEIHDDMEESFLLLEGTVDCYVNDEVFSMVKGDFMQIPLNAHHKVVVTSKTTAKAIRSRVLI